MALATAQTHNATLLHQKYCIAHTEPLDPSATTVHAHVDVTVTTLQDELPMSVETQLTLEALTPPVNDLFEATRVLAIVIVQKLLSNHFDSPSALGTRETVRSFHVDNCFRPLHNTVFICIWASAVLPARSTEVAELRTTSTPGILVTDASRRYINSTLTSCGSSRTKDQPVCGNWDKTAILRDVPALEPVAGLDPPDSRCFGDMGFCRPSR
jgi:hypothetical protein